MGSTLSVVLSVNNVSPGRWFSIKVSSVDLITLLILLGFLATIVTGVVVQLSSNEMEIFTFLVSDSCG